MSNYAVIRTDLMFGTDNRSGLVSVKYMGDGSAATAIENGNVVKLAGLMPTATTGVVEREIFKGVTPSASDSIKDIVVLDGVEIDYDERKKDLRDFINEAGAVIRGYRLHSGSIFSVTAEALDGQAAVGDIVELQAGTKLKVVSSNTSGSTVVGEIIEVAKAGAYTFYAIKVA